MHRPEVASELESEASPVVREATGDLVIVPVDASALAAHGLADDGSPLASASNGTADHTGPVPSNGHLDDPSSSAGNGSSNGSSNGHANGSSHGAGDSTTSGLKRPVVAPAVPYDMAADEPEPAAPSGDPALVIPVDDLVARTPPLRPYIEDPTGPLESEPLDPRTTGLQGPVVTAPTVMTAAVAPAPTIKPGIRLRRRPRPRVRRVRRVIRSVDTWTVFKVSLVFYLAMYVIFLVASVLIWRVANATGTLDNVQTFLTHYGWSTFQFRGGEIYHAVWIIGLFLVVAGIGLNVTMATLFNLIADLVGGVRVTVLEEEVRLRPRVQITKAVAQHVPVAPTPGQTVPMPTSPPMMQPDPDAVELAPDYTSDIVWIAPSSSVAPVAPAPPHAPVAPVGPVAPDAPVDDVAQVEQHSS